MKKAFLRKDTIDISQSALVISDPMRTNLSFVPTSKKEEFLNTNSDRDNMRDKIKGVWVLFVQRPRKEQEGKKFCRIQRQSVCPYGLRMSVRYPPPLPEAGHHRPLIDRWMAG